MKMGRWLALWPGIRIHRKDSRGSQPLALRRSFAAAASGAICCSACESQLKTPRVRLSVRASNDGAIKLYEQEGYLRVDVWQSYYNDGEAAIVMEKTRGI